MFSQNPEAGYDPNEVVKEPKESVQELAAELEEMDDGSEAATESEAGEIDVSNEVDAADIPDSIHIKE